MKNIAKSFILVAAILFIGLAGSLVQAHAQGGVPLWTNRYDGLYYANAIAVDSSGNVFVTGQDYPNTLSDFGTVAYSVAGVPLWTNHYRGMGMGEGAATAIAADHDGNVFVTGYSDAANGLLWDYATVAYSVAGMPLWTNRYNGPANSDDVATGIATDNSGNVFVTGSSRTTIGGAPADYATVAYSNAGVPLWTNRYTGPGNRLDDATAIAVDSSGDVFVTGGSAGANGSSDYATVAYSVAGVPLWTNRYNGPGNSFDDATAIAVDSSGNVFVTGSSVGANSSSDYATVAYSNTDVPLWTNRYNGPGNSYDDAKAIAVDSSGNVFVTGGSYNTNGYSDYATIKYSNAGVPLWTNRLNVGNGSGYAFAIAVDRSGNVFVTGNSGTVAYSNAGETLWTDCCYSAGLLGLDSTGNVFVTFDYSEAGNQTIVTIKYSSSVQPPVHLDFQLLNNQLVLSWTNAGFSLESAPAPTATFTNILDSTSPYTNSMTSAQQYFRLAVP